MWRIRYGVAIDYHSGISVFPEWVRSIVLPNYTRITFHTGARKERELQQISLWGKTARSAQRDTSRCLISVSSPVRTTHILPPEEYKVTRYLLTSLIETPHELSSEKDRDRASTGISLSFQDIFFGGEDGLDSAVVWILKWGDRIIAFLRE